MWRERQAAGWRPQSPGDGSGRGPGGQLAGVPFGRRACGTGHRPDGVLDDVWIAGLHRCPEGGGRGHQTRSEKAREQLQNLAACCASKRLRPLPVAGTSVLAQRSGEPSPECVSPTSILASYTSTHPVPPRASLGDVSGEGRRPGGLCPVLRCCVSEAPGFPGHTGWRIPRPSCSRRGPQLVPPHPGPLVSGKKGVNPLARASESCCRARAGPSDIRPPNIHGPVCADLKGTSCTKALGFPW